jgi:hypothetical protein
MIALDAQFLVVFNLLCPSSLCVYTIFWCVLWANPVGAFLVEDIRNALPKSQLTIVLMPSSEGCANLHLDILTLYFAIPKLFVTFKNSLPSQNHLFFFFGLLCMHVLSFWVASPKLGLGHAILFLQEQQRGRKKSHLKP